MLAQINQFVIQYKKHQLNFYSSKSSANVYSNQSLVAMANLGPQFTIYL